MGQVQGVVSVDLGSTDEEEELCSYAASGRDGVER